MTQLCYSRVLKRNIGVKWVKYIINKNKENSRRSCYHLQRSLTHGNSLPSILNSIFCEIYGFYHINKNIFELPLEAVCLRLESKKCFFSWSYLCFVSTRYLKFFSYLIFPLIYQKISSSHRDVF